MIRERLRELVPLELRQSLAASRRDFADHRAGFAPACARAPGWGSWPTRVTVTQAVRGSDPVALTGKVANLGRAATVIDGMCLAPGDVWSFWSALGRPSSARGYAAGRNIVQGEVVLAAGGGLCQASGILYHLALVAGLEIVERQAHSVDLYHDAERVTPLGADATVAWGYRDLRFRNPYDGTIALRLGLFDDELVAGIAAPGPLTGREVRFDTTSVDADHVRVHTVRDGVTLTTTTYLLRPGLRAGA